ncbi:MAG TPA: PDZ domain-containing protein [Acidimicrobiales bacterium]|nr:PDZ domain-containing protein [Acidimicrobiales bacterium]
MSDIWPTVPPSGGEPTWPGPDRSPLEGAPAGPDGPGHDAPARTTDVPRRLRHYISAVLAVLMLAAVGSAVGVAVHDSGKFLLFSVGDAPTVTADPSCREVSGGFYLPGGVPCVRIEVPRTKVHKLHGRILMVDVEVGPASPLDWAEWQLGLLGSDHEMAPVVDYSGNTPPSQLACQDAQQMQSADEAAALAALTRLGYRGTVREVGALVSGVLAGTPAAKAGLHCGDVITAVNGKAVSGPVGLTELLAPLAPGTAVHLSVTPSSGSGTRHLVLHLAAPPKVLRAEGFSGHSYMGVDIQAKVRLTLPFPLSVNAGNIGGSSAGLAFTLAMLDTLTNGNLTGGHFVGATGTIDPNGQVGDVSGVREKTVAVERAGARVFFVPRDEAATARAVAGARLRVYGVTSLGQVLSILHTRYGGSLPARMAPRT